MILRDIFLWAKAPKVRITLYNVLVDVSNTTAVCPAPLRVSIDDVMMMSELSLRTPVVILGVVQYAKMLNNEDDTSFLAGCRETSISILVPNVQGFNSL